MPVYENTQPPYSVSPGDSEIQIVTPADGTGTLGAGKYSERVTIQDVPGGYLKPIKVRIAYASAPSSTEYDVYGSDVDSNPTNGPSDWYKIVASTNTAGDNLVIVREGAGAVNPNFICVKEVTAPGVKTTVGVRQ